MKKKKRLLIRTTILLILLSAVTYTLYANLYSKDELNKVRVNDQAPDFTLPSIDGEEVNASGFEGKALLINFWGSWCGPCKNEMPAIEEAYNQYKDDGFEVLTINIRESEFAVKKFLESNNLSLPVVMDKEAEVYDAYAVRNLPASFFVTPEGKVNRIYQGEMTREEIDRWVNEILPEKTM
jgi:peroxiredoxin